VGTEGPDDKVHNADLIRWLRELELEEPFEISAIGTDFIEGRFARPLSDPLSLTRRINQLCSEGNQGPQVEQDQAAHLQQQAGFCCGGTETNVTGTS
jgi:hypothetical protein